MFDLKNLISNAVETVDAISPLIPPYKKHIANDDTESGGEPAESSEIENMGAFK